MLLKNRSIATIKNVFSKFLREYNVQRRYERNVEGFASPHYAHFYVEDILSKEPPAEWCNCFNWFEGISTGNSLTWSDINALWLEKLNSKFNFKKVNIIDII